MSSFKFLLKPPVLVAGLILLMFIAMSAGLQKKVAEPSISEKTERTEFDRLETERTRLATLNAPSAVSGQRQTTAERAPTTAKQEPRKQIVEDFDTALRRADGNSYVTGRIFGSDNSDGNDQQRREWTVGSFQFRRISDEDGNTSGGSEENSSRRSNWEDRGNWAERFGRNVPIAGAELHLYEDDPNTTHPPLRTALTDEQGSFTIASLNDADQRYIMVVKAENYAPEATYVTMSHEPRQVFMRLEEGHELRGKVLDKETSQPVAGAVIYQPNSRWEAFSALGTTTSSITGEFVFPNVQRGNSLTQAQASGYATTRARVRAPDENTIIEMQSGGASISGVTVDRLTGKPHGGARVWAETGRDTRESVVSAEDGTFTIENLPEGTFEVYAVRGMKSESKVIELERRQKITDVELILPAEVLVSGLVINASDRKPLEGIKIWFESAKGAQHRKTNAEGRFAFETMAIEEYSLLIHEKGFLPVKDKRSTGSDETITREISKNQSSDEVTIRLRPVPTLEGNVRAEGGRDRGRGDFASFLGGGFGGRSGAGGPGGSRAGGGGMAVAAASASASGVAAGGEGGEQRGTPVYGADLTLSYVDGTKLVQLTTRSDPAGNFFFNLPKGRGQGIIVAKNQFLMDVKDIKVPRKNPVQLTLRRDLMVGSLLLSDESPLDGVRVDVSRWIPRNRASSERAKRVTMTNMNSMRGGRIFSALPRDEDIELTFYMPDGVAVSKDFKTNQLLNSRPIFIYDPVSQDILADTSPRQRNREGGGRRGNRADRPNAGSEGGWRRNNQNNNGAAQPSPARESGGGQGAVPVTGQPAAAPAQ